MFIERITKDMSQDAKRHVMQHNANVREWLRRADEAFLRGEHGKAGNIWRHVQEERSRA